MRRKNGPSLSMDWKLYRFKKLNSIYRLSVILIFIYDNIWYFLICLLILKIIINKQI